ncbi:MAG: nitroreductase family protein [Oscillospiraceae bacterium]
MDAWELMEQRHSVRQYEDKSMPDDIIYQLEKEIEKINAEENLHFQLVKNEPKAFDGFMAHYGKFSGVRNYIALIGPKSKELDKKCGYYGEKLVLMAQGLGLNSCWVAMSYSKIPGAFTVNQGEKLVVVIAIGYGSNQGSVHKSKNISAVSNVSAETPDWFESGVKAALLAPTAMNQQKFIFNYNNGDVSAKAGIGFYTKIDLGIAIYHFELGSGKRFIKI